VDRLGKATVEGISQVKQELQNIQQKHHTDFSKMQNLVEKHINDQNLALGETKSSLEHLEGDLVAFFDNMEEWKIFVEKMHKQNIQAYTQHSSANQLLEQANFLLQQRISNLETNFGSR
jgi:hypothetical protein